MEIRNYTREELEKISTVEIVQYKAKLWDQLDLCRRVMDDRLTEEVKKREVTDGNKKIH